jgi:undecaprenyl-diphosphatase
VDKPWIPTLKFFLEFIGSEFGLLNPIFFVGIIWASVAFWRRSRHNPRLIYFFSMGAPLFVCYLLYSFRSRLLPNWIAPAVLPLFCLMVAYGDTRLRLGSSKIKQWLSIGLVLGLVMVVFGLQTDLIPKLIKYRLPVKLDPLHRIRKWSDIAETVGNVRNELLVEGKPVFIICDHYGMAGQISFYLPEARARVKTDPLVYYKTSDFPRNQFFFWPGYTNRHGETAIFVRELDRAKPKTNPPPPVLQAEFENVTDLGVRNVLYHGQVLRPLHFFACRGLK